MKRIVVVAVLALLAGLFPIQSAWAAPAIQLLNPSAYNPSPEVSTKADIDGAYHFVAWVPTVPPNAIVEFEVRPAAGNAITIEGNRVGTDTFEAFHSLSGLPDGTYTVSAILYSNGTQVLEGVDRQTVTIRNGSVGQSETAEILYPGNGGQLGFFTPKGALARTVVDVKTSDGARQVRVLYTSSRPGTEPEWVQCGTGAVTGGSASVRCTLADDKTSFSNITAIAAVANQTQPPGPASPALDDSGDAHRVFTYASVPSRVIVDPETVQAEVATCQTLVARVLDQQSRPLVGVNVDVHAVGPTDELQFARKTGTSAFQAPNGGPHSTEQTRRCTDLDAEGTQGETNRVGNPDEKHIESAAAGTNNAGAFTFALYSATIGGTNVTAWADLDDDDVQAGSEASGGARIGWGQAPPPAVRQVFLEPGGASGTVGSCVRLTLTAKEGGNPLSGANLDVHVEGADVGFCTPSDGSATRTPDTGEHIAGTHSDGTKHIEGEADSFGRLVFGVAAASAGEVTVTGWIDETDDDTLSGEPAATTKVSFGVSGDRTISLDASRRRVPSGRRVRLFGAISGSEACEGEQTVKLKARAPGTRFRTIGSQTTSASGEYAFRVRVRRTKDYKAIAPRNGVCEKARSGTVRVRAT